MKYPGFCGGSAPHRSTNVNSECAINFFPHFPDGNPKSKVVNIYTPGLTPYVTLNVNGPVRDLFYHDGRCFAVSGEDFFEITAANTAVNHGTVGMDANPAVITSNGIPGHQVLVISNGDGFIFDLNANTLTQIADGDFPASCEMADFVDGYFVLLNRTENRIELSDLFDGLSYDTTMRAQRNLASDELAAMAVVHRNLWLFGRQRTEVWYNSGDDFPLQPILSAGVIEAGCLAPFSVKRVDNSIIWLGSDERGGVTVWRADGYRPVRVSTDAVDASLNRYTSLTSAIAWTYLQEGHSFYVLYVPGEPDQQSGVPWTTWVYDVATNLWHERGLWRSELTKWHPNVGRCHCYDYVNNLNLVGDRQSGTVYRMSMDLLNEVVTRTS